MSRASERADNPGSPEDRRKAATAHLVCALMLLSSLIILSWGASSDPYVVDNTDDTQSVVWDFDEPSDYELSGVEMSGGDARLNFMNRSDGDDDAADWNQGTLTNLDLSVVPGSVTVDSTEAAYQLVVQLGPSVTDSYLMENKINDNFGTSHELALDSELGKRCHVVLWFDLSAMPAEAVVVDAQLHMWKLMWSKGSEVVFDLHEIQKDFVESEVCWSKHESASMWSSPGGDYESYSHGRYTVDNEVGPVRMDLSKAVERWVTSPSTNHGIIMVPVPDGGDNQKIFQSSQETDSPERNPKLVVNYTIPGGIGVLESRGLGPGTNATFTLASWSASVTSLLDDEFSGSALSDKWAWLNDPTLLGGSYDVGLSAPGWVRVTGSSNSVISGTTVACNYLHQDVTGDFIAYTHVNELFTASEMRAGLLLYEGPREWVYVAKTDPGAGGTVKVFACENGTSIEASSIPWTDHGDAHLKMERNATGIWLHASEDGVTYTQLYRHSPALDMIKRLSIGIFVSSSTSSRPVAEFDRFTVTSLTGPTVEVRVRTGNSTSFSDPSWTAWSASPIVTSPTVPGTTARYLQYRLYMSTLVGWYVPVFSSFGCSCELYGTSGTVETRDYVPTDFSMWYTMTTDETSDGGTVRYSYSTDQGDTWVTAGTGGSYAITSTDPSLRIRMRLETYDTLVTPVVHQVSATHSTAISYIQVVAPAEAVAGEPFPITIYIRDSSDATMVHWSGPVSLTAMREDCVHVASSTLAVESATITGGGQVTVPNQAYTFAETIVIKAAAQDAYGFSQPITVVSGAPASVHITPVFDTALEHSTHTLAAYALDAFGNDVGGQSFAWAIDPDIGTLSAYTGQTVVYTAGSADSSGLVEVASSGLTASLFITVVHETSAPYFIQPVPDQVKDEDFGAWSIDLSPYVRDSVHWDDELRWYVTNESVVDVRGENRTGDLMVTLSTIPDLAGTDLLHVYVVDPDGLYAVASFRVTIVPVNDWPVIDQIDPLLVRYDVLYVYNMRYHVHDVDNTEDELTLMVDEDSRPYVTVQKLALYLLYPAALNGTTQTVIVTVSDGMFSVSVVIRVSVTNDNVPVTVDVLPDLEMNQGETLLGVLDLDEYFIDPDGEPLSYSYDAGHVGVNISSDNEVDISAPSDWYGTEYVVFTAVDPRGARVENAMTVVVHKVNQAPAIDGVPDLFVKAGLRYEFDLAMYISDPDDDLDILHVTTNDEHAVPVGLVLTLLYPDDHLGQEYLVEIVVSDGELTGSCAILVTVGDNTPPTVGRMAAHCFHEDLPTPYPSIGSLDDSFDDLEDGSNLTFEVFVLSDKVSCRVIRDMDGDRCVAFTTEPNWHGETWFVVRATDSGGALAEAAIELTVRSCPDPPVLVFTETVEVTAGIQSALDISRYASDPDLHPQGLLFSVGADYFAYVQMVGGVLIVEFPDGFLRDGEDSKLIGLSVTVTDPDGLYDTQTLNIKVVRRAADGDNDQWVLVALGAMGAVAAGSLAVAMRLRKRPFVIRDIMLIHNDGFLIGRAAEKHEGEIDEDVLSGMLTAVLNFVEDSMSGTQDGLRNFGFEHYKVLVKRGKMTYMAVVYEGDEPESVEDKLGELIAKVEKIYRKRIESWTGDMDTDFAGVEVLLKGFVKENGKRSKGLNGETAAPEGDAPAPEAASE